MANTLNSQRNGAVGFIDWLGVVVIYFAAAEELESRDGQLSVRDKSQSLGLGDQIRFDESLGR